MWKPSAQSAPAEAGIYSTELEQYAQRGRLLESRGLWSRPLYHAADAQQVNYSILLI